MGQVIIVRAIFSTEVVLHCIDKRQAELECFNLLAFDFSSREMSNRHLALDMGGVIFWGGRCHMYPDHPGEVASLAGE